MLLGLGFALNGIIIIPMLPTLMVDVVIDPEHIADKPKRAEILSILKKAWGNMGTMWSYAGLIVIAISGLGLRAICTSDRSSSDA